MSNGDVVYTPSSKGFEDCANGPEIAAALRVIGEEAKSTAEGLAQDFRVTGDYADSFELSFPIADVVKGNPRRVALLTNTSGHAAAVEWGYGGRAAAEGQSAHHVLKRTLDSLGS